MVWPTEESNMSDKKDTNPKDGAATNRLDLTLFPDSAVAYGALALTEGHLKYGAYNWRVAGVKVSVYVAACKRHLAKYYNGEWADSKTGVSHLASALASIAILIDAESHGLVDDDRPPVQSMNGTFESTEYKTKHLRALFPDGPGRYTEEAEMAKKLEAGEDDDNGQ